VSPGSADQQQEPGIDAGKSTRGRTVVIIAGALAALGLLLILCLRGNVFPFEDWHTDLSVAYAALLLMVPLPLILAWHFFWWLYRAIIAEARRPFE
jgi:uncharacterized BrkB/YihY/UPF0761 family membrane protein